LSRLDQKLQLPQQLSGLIREQVASINTCLFCMDAARSYAMKEPAGLARFDALPGYRASPLFTDAERAALDYATELTRDKKVDPGTFARLARMTPATGGLRHRVARGQRAPLQHDQHRSQHRLRRPVRLNARGADRSPPRPGAIIGS
jgi:hypothetical protein